MPQGAGEVVDHLLRLGDGGLDGDDVLHILRLGQQRLEPLQLDLLGFQATLGVVVPLADILLLGVPPGLVAQRPRLVQEGLVLLRRDADGVVRPAAIAPLAHTAGLEVAAHLLRQIRQALDSLLKVGGLQVHLGGADELLPCGVGHPAGGGTAGIEAQILLRLCRRHGICHVRGGGLRRELRRFAAAAGGQGQYQQQCKRQREQSSFHGPSSFMYGPALPKQGHLLVQTKKTGKMFRLFSRQLAFFCRVG